MDDLRGIHVLLTGASGALGTAVAMALVASGARVVAVARRRTGLDALRAELFQHDRLEVAEGDVADGPEVERLFDAVERGGGPLDAVVHAVGTFAHGPLATLEDDTIARLVGTNLVAAAHVLRASLRRMVPRRQGRVVVVTGIAAEGPAPGSALYAATKAATSHLVQSAAAEAHASGVTVNAVLPGVMDTPENRRAMPGGDPARWVSTAAVAKAVVTLLGAGTGGVTGSLFRLPDRLE